MKTLLAVAFIFFISTAVVIAHSGGGIEPPRRRPSRPRIIFDDHDNKVMERFVSLCFSKSKYLYKEIFKVSTSII